jgi:hypothetical protein
MQEHATKDRRVQIQESGGRSREPGLLFALALSQYLFLRPIRGLKGG